MFATDEEYILVWFTKPIADPDESTDNRPNAWVKLVYGNDGWDVICDYTINLETIIDPINDYSMKKYGWPKEIVENASCNPFNINRLQEAKTE